MYLFELPYEILLKEISPNFSLKDLLQVCQVNQQFRDIVDNKELYKIKLEKEFSRETILKKPNTYTYKGYYRLMIRGLSSQIYGIIKRNELYSYERLCICRNKTDLINILWRLGIDPPRIYKEVSTNTSIKDMIIYFDSWNLDTRTFPVKKIKYFYIWNKLVGANLICDIIKEALGLINHLTIK
jgi:hypothetical protein